MINPFKQRVLRGTERVLALLNRNPLSSTYGCFDRNFWHFKTIIDFPSSTYQQVVVGLAHLFSTAAPENPFHGSPVLKDAIRAGVFYWCEIQNRDGSQNEYYQNDRSFCPTAFTTYGIAETLLLMGDHFSEVEKARIHRHLLLGARWLARHRFAIVQNQMMASMNALYQVWKVTQDDGVRRSFEARRAEVLASQSAEGWFPEYGGADTGYSYKQLYLLSSYLTAAGDDAEVLAAASRLVDFLTFFLHPDGTSGGDYNSRSTQHVMPYAIDFFHRRLHSESTALLAAWYYRHTAADETISSLAMDDKYQSYFYYNSDVQSFLSFREAPDTAPVKRAEGVTNFEQAGIVRIEVGDLLVWLSRRRSGVIRAFHQGKLVYSDSGYVLKVGGRLCATQCDDAAAVASVTSDGDRVRVSVRGNAGVVDDSLPLVRWIVPFKFFCRTLLWFDFIGYWFNDKLKADLIARQVRVPVTLEREFSLASGGLAIRDRIVPRRPGIKISDVYRVRDFTVVHSPSSRFYQHQYLLSGPAFVEGSDGDSRTFDLEMAFS